MILICTMTVFNAVLQIDLIAMTLLSCLALQPCDIFISDQMANLY